MTRRIHWGRSECARAGVKRRQHPCTLNEHETRPDLASVVEVVVRIHTWHTGQGLFELAPIRLAQLRAANFELSRQCVNF